MKLHFLAIAAVGTLAIGNAAQADTSEKAKVKVQASQIVAARKAGMMLSGANMGAIKGGIDRGDDPKKLVFASSALVAWSKALPCLFPQGSMTADSKAKPEIWKERAAFNVLAQNFATDTALLLDYAKAGDATNFSSQWAKVRTNCAACHDKYQAK